MKLLKKGVVIFTMISKRYELEETLKGYSGSLPKDAAIGIDPNESR